MFSPLDNGVPLDKPNLNRIIINPDENWNENANNNKIMLNNLWNQLDEATKTRILHKIYVNTDAMLNDIIPGYEPDRKPTYLRRINALDFNINIPLRKRRTTLGKRRSRKDNYSEITTFDDYAESLNDAELFSQLEELAKHLPEPDRSVKPRKGGKNRRTKKRRNIRYNK
jgi:hypothetical protein